MIVLIFFLLFMAANAGIAFGCWRLRKVRQLEAAQAEGADLAYHVHLQQLPKITAELEAECGMEPTRYTYDRDEFDKLTAEGIEVYDYSNLPKPSEQYMPERGGWVEVQEAQETYPCCQCGFCKTAPEFSNGKASTCNECSGYNRAYNKLNFGNPLGPSEAEVEPTDTCSRCHKDFPLSVMAKSDIKGVCPNCQPYVQGYCTVCGAKFDGAMHIAIANGENVPVICSTCEIQRQKKITVERGMRPDQKVADATEAMYAQGQQSFGSVAPKIMQHTRQEVPTIQEMGSVSVGSWFGQGRN